MSHSPPHFRAIRLSGRSRSPSGRLVVNPCSADTRQYCASGFTPPRSSSSCTATPSNVLSSRLHRVTQCMSQFTVLRGSASSSRSEEHTSELQSQSNLVCRLLLEKKKTQTINLCTSTKRYSGGAS